MNSSDSLPLFSIIVPVFNVKGYIENTVESILNQTYRNFELLLIDDGSTDGSGEYIDYVALTDRRVKAIHQQNGGVSSARNHGLDSAHGKWIVFVDGDDLLRLNALQILADCIGQYPESDLIGYRYELIDSKFSSRREAHKSYMSKLYDCRNYINVKVLDHYMVWGETFRREIATNIRFKPLKNGEDVLFCNELGCHASFYLEIDAELYLYLQRKSSARANTWTEQRFDDYAQMHELILDNILYCKKQVDPKWLTRWCGSLLQFVPQLWEQSPNIKSRYFTRHRMLMKKIIRLCAVPKYLKLWLRAAIAINSKSYYRMIAIFPMQLYIRLNNNR